MWRFKEFNTAAELLVLLVLVLLEVLNDKYLTIKSFTPCRKKNKNEYQTIIFYVELVKLVLLREVLDATTIVKESQQLL
jgi:hypothetical protein